MSGPGIQVWSRWCYSLVESSMNDLSRMIGSLSTVHLRGAWNLRAGSTKPRSWHTVGS